MNIGIITTWFQAGGGYVSKAYEEVLSKDNKVFIYARGGQNRKNDADWDKENVTWAPSHKYDIQTKHFINWAKKNKIDVLFFNEQRFWKPVVEAKKQGFCIGAYIDYYTQQTLPAFEIYDFVICNTKRHYSAFDWHPNANYIPWGTNIEKFKPVSDKNRAPSFMISAGWQAKFSGDRRGSLLALKAFTKVEGNCQLLVYSQVKYQDCLPEWQRLISSDKRINFKHGTFDPFPFEEGDVYLYPSRLDGIGLTLPEALASGLTSIVTNNAPMNEFVQENLNGKLVDVERYLGRSDGYYWPESICNIDSLTANMQFYVENPIILQEHKKNARNNALEVLDWNRNAKNISEIFSKSFLNNNKVSGKKVIDVCVELDKHYSPSIFYKGKLLVTDVLKYFKII